MLPNSATPAVLPRPSIAPKSANSPPLPNAQTSESHKPQPQSTKLRPHNQTTVFSRPEATSPRPAPKSPAQPRSTTAAQHSSAPHIRDVHAPSLPPAPLASPPTQAPTPKSSKSLRQCQPPAKPLQVPTQSPPAGCSHTATAPSAPSTESRPWPSIAPAAMQSPHRPTQCKPLHPETQPGHPRGSHRSRARFRSPPAGAPPKPKSCCKSETRRQSKRCNSAAANSSETPPASCDSHR